MARKVPLNKLADAVSASTEEFLQIFLMEMSEQVVQNTPVLGGLLRGSNELSLNGNQASVGTPDKSGNATVSKMDTQAKKATPGDSIYFTNGAPYAGIVEAGSSKKAPDGFMLRSAMEAPRISQSAARKVK